MQVSNEIIKILDYLGEKFGVAIDWTASNVMPFVNQLMEKYISWEISTSTAWIVICSIFFLVCVLWTILDFSNDWSDGLCLIATMPIIAFTIIGIIIQIFDILRCINFPELQIFNYVKSLVESK